MEISCQAISTYASAQLVEPGIFAVRAHFAHVLNLTDGRYVLSVQDERISRTPLSIVLEDADFAAFDRHMRDRAGLTSNGGVLRCGALVLSTHMARRFSCRLAAHGTAAPESERCKMLKSGAALLAKPDSFAFVGADDLAAWAGGERTEAQLMARKLLWEGRPWDLVGLGAGLTPAGDDFLVGLLAVRRAWGDESRLKALAERIAPLTGRTGELSGAFLRAALAGEFSLPVLRLLQALQDDTEQLMPALAGLCAVGHSSGSDLLGGVLYGLHGYFTREGIS